MNSKRPISPRRRAAKRTAGSQKSLVSLPRFEGHYPKKWVECEKCGHVNLHPKAYPLKLSSCKTCGSTRIRIYKEKRQANDMVSDGGPLTHELKPKREPAVRCTEC